MEINGGERVRNVFSGAGPIVGGGGRDDGGACHGGRSHVPVRWRGRLPLGNAVLGVGLRLGEGVQHTEDSQMLAHAPQRPVL